MNYPKIKKMSPQIVVADLDRSLEFYTKELGFILDFRHDDFYAGILKDGCSIHLKLGTPPAGERNNKRKNEDLDIVFSVEAVEDLYTRLANSAIEITQPLCDRPYGKEFYISDPDGYILAFLAEV
ncbi:MAG: VOC family protein [Chitinophagaceae bacterium]